MLATSDIPRIKHDARPCEPGSFSDEVLWASFKNGNQLALSMLYKRNVQALYSYGRQTSRDHDLILDCIQELFSRLWVKRDTLAAVNSVKSYLFKSFRRTLLRQIIAKRNGTVPFINQTGAFEFIPLLKIS